MSLQSDIIALMSGSPEIAGGKVYPQAAPADAELPFVIYRIFSKEPISTLNNSEDLINSIVAFECYADDYQEALDLADDVKARMSTTSMDYYKTSSPGEEYVPLTDDFMEPVYYGFWHT